MMDVEGLERALLEGARKELSPSASDRMRIQSRLVGNAAWFEPAPVRRSGLRGLARSWRGGLALGFAMGALIGFGASRGVGHAWQRWASDPAHALATAELARPPAAPAAAIEGPAEAAAEQTARSASPDSEPVLIQRVPPPRARVEGSARGAVSPVPHAAEEEGGSTLARELALLQRARRALNRNDGMLALGIVQSLDERFPNGVLMEERAATRILSLCQLERQEEARERGHRFLLDHPRSVYAERVRHSCAGGQ